MDVMNLEINSQEYFNQNVFFPNSNEMFSTFLPPTGGISLEEEIQSTLKLAATIAQEQIKQFINLPQWETKMETAFGAESEPSTALFDLLLLAKGESLPSVEILSGEDLGGAKGAYSNTTETIYLSADFLALHAEEPETVARVLVEEMGHYLDSKINSQDAQGDEGEIFALQVFGETLEPFQLKELQAEDDSGWISINSQLLPVEFASVHTKWGNPSGASYYNYNNLLLEKSQYVLSYNASLGRSNWCSWQLNTSWLGSVGRTDNFRPDSTLPSGIYPVDGNDYSGSGYDRGHLCPSGDRTRTSTDNSATFLMTNMIPQAPGNNQGPWAQLENYSRDLAYQGKELSIVAGGYGIKGTIAGGQVDVPTYTWKVILIQDSPYASVTQNTQTLAVWMPNSDIRSSDWRNYIVSVDTVERNTGYNFFSAISDTTEATIESRIYSTAFAFALSSTPISTASLAMAPLSTDSNLAGQFSTTTNLREIDPSATLTVQPNQSNPSVASVDVGSISLSNTASQEAILSPMLESLSSQPPLLPLFAQS